MRRLDDARTAATEAISYLGENEDLLGELGAISYAERDYDKAIEFFDRALDLNPYETFALQWRVASLRKQGKPSRAQEKLTEALEKMPYDTRLWEEYGWLAFDQNKFEEAIKHFDKATELDPYVITRQLAKVEALVRLNRSDESLAVFKRLGEQFPDDAEIAEQRCWFHIRFGQLEAAREQQMKLRQAQPNSALGLNALGGYELAMRNYTSAARAFREAVNRVDYEPLSFQTVPTQAVQPTPQRCVNEHGFSLHAEVCCTQQRKKLESQAQGCCLLGAPRTQHCAATSPAPPSPMNG